MKTMIRIAALVVAVAATSRVAHAGPAEDSLFKCQKTLATETQKLSAGYNKAVGACLTKISSELIKNQAGSVEGAVATCVSKLRLLKDSRMIGKSLEEKFRAKVSAVCDPSSPGVAHTWEDMYGIGNTVVPSMELRKMGNVCSSQGFNIIDFNSFLSCSVKLQKLETVILTARSYPSARASLAELSLQLDILNGTPVETDPTRYTDAKDAVDNISTIIANYLGL